jgi:hypothetical protein
MILCESLFSLWFSVYKYNLPFVSWCLGGKITPSNLRLLSR